jgi:nucleoside-diphosphate-sugar epimerase
MLQTPFASGRILPPPRVKPHRPPGHRGREKAPFDQEDEAEREGQRCRISGGRMAVDSQADSRLGAFRGARVMITGGIGQIGSALARRLLALGADLLLVDSMIPEYGGNFANIADVEGRVRVNISDIRDSHAMRHMLGGQDFLFNLAGQTSHVDSMTAPDDDLAINCAAQLHLLESCRAVAPEIVIVHASTRQIYGRPRYLPVDEAHPLHPVDVNGVNKIAGEHYHILYHDVYGIKTRALRLTNVYGPGMRIKDARQNFLGIWLRLAVEGRAFEVWGGEQRRDMLYIEDAVDAFLGAAVSPATEGLALNVGGDAPYTLTDIAAALVNANGGGTYTIREFPEERKKIDVGDFVTDDRKFRELADWAPRTNLGEGLSRSVAYYRPRMALYL